MPKDWLSSLVKKLLEDPIGNPFILFVSIIIIYSLTLAIYHAYGFITAIGYVFACTYGLTKIIDDPRRTVAWAVGFIIGAVASNMFFEIFIPTIRGGDATSVYSALIILFVIFMFYLKAKELKSA